MRVKLSEPVNPRYIYVNPVTNTVHLMIPVAVGTEIGLDNTCKTVLALQEFFGKRSDSAQLENSARHELIRYKKALKDDLDILEAGETKRIVQDRLNQVIGYIDTLSSVESHPSLNALSGGHPIYPQAVKDLLAATASNLYSMLLRPTLQDGMLNVHHPKFTMDRARPAGTLFHQLHDVFATISKVTSHTHSDNLLSQAMASLSKHPLPVTLQALLPAVVNTLSSRFRDKFNIDVSFAMDRAELQILGYEQTDNITDVAGLKALVEGVINTKNAGVPIFPLESPFSSIVMPIEVDKLSIMAQFLLAEINFYAHANGLSIANFGQVLDNDPILAKGLASDIKKAIENGMNIEQVVVQYIIKNRVTFGINESFSALDISKIAKRFANHYEVIKESPHFDEFMVLDHDKRGGFFAHQGSLCFDFSDLMRTNDFRTFDNRARYTRARGEIKDIPVVVPGREIDAIGSITLDDAAIKAAVIAAINDDDYSTVRRFLLSTLEDGRKVFELFGREFFAEFDTDAQARNLFIQIRRTIKDAALSNRFNRIVRGQDAQLLLTPVMARSLYVSAVSRTVIPQEMTLQYSTLSAIQALLNHLGIANATVTAGFNGNFVIDSTQANVEALQRKIEPFTTAIHVTSSIAKSLYKQVGDRYGDGSPEYLGMMALNNHDSGPQKLMKALALLHVNFVKDNADVVRANSTDPDDMAFVRSNLLFPNHGAGQNGFVIHHIQADSIQLIEGIHEFQAQRFKLTEDIERAIYQSTVQLAPQARELLDRLLNDVRPDKLEAVLMLLGIDYGRIEFNPLGGYYVYLSEAEQAKLKFIANLPLTPEERALIPGYRFAVEMPDNKSARGFLFEDILQRAWQNPQPGPGGAQGEREPTGIRVQKARAFRAAPIPEQINPADVELNCPEHILLAFQRMLRASRLLGTNFVNPYTNRLEQFPVEASQLTARHLQILARNEAQNYSGVMRVSLYNQFLSDDQVAQIRCLVKATTVAGITYATHVGGYPRGTPRTPCLTPQKTIVIDQPSLQWLGDLRNMGGLFFYPQPLAQDNIPRNYGVWQDATYRALFGAPRPAAPTDAILNVVWNGIRGQLDLNGVSNCIETEFSQALDAAVSQGRYLAAEEPINFIYLKAGTGHSLSRLALGAEETARFEEARLQGILQALRRVRALPEIEQRTVIGKIGRIELPFSGNLATNTLSDIQSEVEGLGLLWGGATNLDAYTPRAGFVNATTSCGVSHAMVGNGGHFLGISAAFAENSYLDHLNPCFNIQMTPRVSPWPNNVPIVAEPRATVDRAKQHILDGLEQLIVNIREKRNDRATWFTLNTDSKSAKLQAIANWLNANELSRRQKIVIMAMIRDVCAIKRNYLGFHSPHSLSEFNQMFHKRDIERIRQVSFTDSDLKGLETNPDAVDELLSRVTVVERRRIPG